MADSIYDFIAAGVPHSVSQVEISEAEFEKLGFSAGCVTPLGKSEFDQVKHLFQFRTKAESGAAVKLAVDLACMNSRVAVLDLGSPPPVIQFPQKINTDSDDLGSWHANTSSTANACRLNFNGPNGLRATAINYGSVDSLGLRHSAMAARSTKVLCLEDRLWDVADGAKFATMAIDVARSAGRKTMLVCKDSECIFRNKEAIRSISDKGIDCVVGESEPILLLHNLNRLDSLVPRLRALNTNAILWRGSHPPLVIQKGNASCTKSIGQITSENFWSSFLPDCLSRISSDQELHAFSN
jgi:hypothetical protein